MPESTREFDTFRFEFLATHFSSVVQIIKMSSFRQLKFFFSALVLGCSGCFSHRMNTLGSICDWHSFFLDKALFKYLYGNTGSQPWSRQALAYIPYLLAETLNSVYTGGLT